MQSNGLSQSDVPAARSSTRPSGRTDRAVPTMIDGPLDEALVLVVGHEHAAASVVRLALEGERIRTAMVAPERLLDEIETHGPALVILCWRAPDATILSEIESLHALGAAALVVGPRPQSRMLCAALDGGAEDWIAWPFHPDELAARCRAILRRRLKRQSRTLVAGEVEIDLDARVARARDRPLALTPSDWDVLERLGRRPGTVVPHAELGAAERSAATEGALARARVARLRRRLAAAGAPGLIRLVHSEGYRLDLD